MLTLNGRAGEGGGQIVRSALALSLITGTAVRIEHVRGRRKRPGLLRQHLACVRLAAEIGQATVEGAVVGSNTLVFRPGAVRAGDYTAAVGSAGSALLVLQSVLPALLTLDAPSSLTLEGGTHNPMSPPFPFVEHAFLPALRRFGPRVTATLERHGFYPAGGGRLVVRVEPVAALAPVELLERGPVEDLFGEAIVSGLPPNVAHRERKALLRGLREAPHPRIEVVDVPSPRGPGNAVWIAARTPEITAVFAAFGEKRKRAEAVATEAFVAYELWKATGAPICPHLADQLMLPLALAGAGAYRTGALTQHSRTNLSVINRFLGPVLRAREVEGGVVVEA